MSQEQTKKDLFHVALSKQVAEQIKRGTVSWLQARENEHIDLPYNPITGKNYTAANNMVLSAKGYADNRWLTYDQAAEQGCQVKKGEKATEIAFYHYIDYKTKEKLDKPKIQTVKLFNAEQLTGIEKMPGKVSNKEEALAKVQSIFENSQVKIVNNQKDKVFYRSKDDTIYMPPKEAYKDELAYSSAAIHELCRWAGNGEERLNYETVPFGTEAFARQKLRTEIASYMLCKELGIPFEPEGQQFADQWVQVIEKSPFEILNAAKDAEKMKGFLMEFDKTLEKAQELEQGQDVQVEQTQPIKQPEQEEKQTEQAPKKEWKEMIKLSVSYDDKDEAKKLGAKWSGKQETWYVLEGTDLQPFYKWLPKEKKVELIMASRDYLDVPREEKDEAKALGAKWDKYQKAWYVEKGTDLGLFAKWNKLDLTERNVSQSAEQTPKEQAVSQMAEPKQEQAAESKQERTEKQEVSNPAQDKTFIAVPYDERKDAKALGAKWDAENKSWYVEKGADLNQFKDWLVDENTIVPAKQEAVSPEIEFAEHCRANGLDVDAPIMDGQIHRVPLIGKPGGKDGAYCAFLDGVPAGWSQNYVTGEKSKFISSGVQLTEEEKAKQRAEHARKLQEREAKRQIGYDNAAKRAEKIYKEAFEVTAQNIHSEDSYLGKKGVLPYVAKQNYYGQLVIPLHNIEGEIRGVQFINKDGSKHFLTGIEKKGNFTLLSDDVKNATKVLVCEGFATGASLHEATKLPVVVAFDAGNLEEVSKALAEKYKGIEITVCADNDQYKDNNVGLECAKKAALAVNGKLAVPQFTKEEQARKLTDFNDLHKAQGLEAVTRQVSQAKSLTQKQSKQSQLAR